MSSNCHRYNTFCYPLTCDACHWTVDIHVKEHTHGGEGTDTGGLDVIFMLFQLLGAERLPAGSVWSHWDAVHLSEEGTPHWDRSSMMSSSLSLSLSISLCHYLPPSIPPSTRRSLSSLFLLLSLFVSFMCCCYMFASEIIILCRSAEVHNLNGFCHFVM